MYIKSRTANIVYKLIIGILAGIGLALEFATFGQPAWRLFATWFLLFTTIYYIVSALIFAIAKKRQSSKTLCPMLQGAILIAGIFLLTARLISWCGDFYLPGAGGLGSSLIEFLLPILVFCDWLVFSQKGFWRTVEPWYWLAFPALYFCFIMLTALVLPSASVLRYPYDFLDFSAVGFDTMCWSLGIIALLILVFGYLCVTLDFALSGKLGQHVVLPKIKVMVIEEEAPDAVEDTEDKKKQAEQNKEQAKTQAKPSEKPAKAQVEPVKAQATQAEATQAKSPVPKVVEGIVDVKSAKTMHSGNNNRSKKQKQLQTLQNSMKKKVSKPAPNKTAKK